MYYLFFKLKKRILINWATLQDIEIKEGELEPAVIFLTLDPLKKGAESEVGLPSLERVFKAGRGTPQVAWLEGEQDFLGQPVSFGFYF